MMTRKRLILIAICSTALMAASFVVARPAASGSQSVNSRKSAGHLVVHEWGTFTSIAGKNGFAVEWRPLNAASDLPTFVYDTDGLTSGIGLRHGKRCFKCETEALVRMETPVIYFYSDRETVVSVSVAFNGGKITEWYPQARTVYVPGPNDLRNPSIIDWGRITVMPGSEENFPIEAKPSHYYPARETDAAPIRVCAGRSPEREKFLFYRGVGTFDLPVAANIADGKVLISNTSRQRFGRFILFENQNGRIGYRIQDKFKGDLSLERPELNQTLEALEAELQAILVEQGLYDKEALAMIKTWHDSWFEEGLRILYVLPRAVTDSVLPINIDPKPSELTRVLVGRVEIVTPEMEKGIENAISTADVNQSVQQAADKIRLKYGRFAEPVLKTVLEKTSDPERRERIQQIISYSASDPH
jgi:hypothetical protein